MARDDRLNIDTTDDLEYDELDDDVVFDDDEDLLDDEEDDNDDETFFPEDE